MTTGTINKKPNISSKLRNLPPLSETVRTNNSAQVPQNPEERQVDTISKSISSSDDEIAAIESSIKKETHQESPRIGNSPVTYTVSVPKEIREIPIISEKTYMSLGKKETGFVELDLVNHRERGQERRYLNIQISGWSFENEEQVSDAYMMITSEAEFEAIKTFFSNLTWKD